MNKELKRELFNIYDVVVFEDENGITQDCVCAITKWEKEIDKIVGVIECNNHSISIYENGSYKIWEKDGKNLPYYNTGKKIIHLYTLKNDNRFYEVYPTSDYEDINDSNFNYVLECLKVLEGCADAIGDYSHRVEPIKQALQRLESIDNANPSEAMKFLEEWYGFLMADNDTTYSNGYENEIEYNRRKETIYKQYNTIKQTLIKSQEQEKKNCEGERSFIRFVEMVTVSPTEALKSVLDIYRNGVFISNYDAFGKQHPTNISPETNKSISEQCDIIKGTLLIAQDYEKVLGILKEKNVDIKYLKKCKTVKKYNKYCKYKSYLTQEEFELLKRWLNV